MDILKESRTLRFMPIEPYKPIIFISYAHADEPEKSAEGEVRWLSFVTGYLSPAVKQGAVEMWIDTLMRIGDDWDPEIERRLRVCDIFILLASRYSLSSSYVVDKEIAIIRGRQASGENVRFCPLLLTPTPKIALEMVRDKNLRPRDGKALSDYSINERFRQMSDVADEIADIASEMAGRRRLIATQIRSTQPREETAKLPDGVVSIYVSYAEVDDEPPPETPNDCFVRYLREQLRWELAQLGLERTLSWVDRHRIAKGGQLDLTIGEALRKAELLLVVMSNNWILSPFCREELRAFAETYRTDEVLGRRERIIVVGKDHVESSNKPVELGPQDDFLFYARNEQGQVTSFFQHKITKDYYRQLRELAEALKRSIDKIAQSHNVRVDR